MKSFKGISLFFMLALGLMLFSSLSVSAVGMNCSLDLPGGSSYFSTGNILLNTSANFSTIKSNITNVTWTFSNGIGTFFTFTNDTINGSDDTNIVTNGQAFWTSSIAVSSLTANLEYTLNTACYNDTDSSVLVSNVTGVSRTITVDTLSPQVSIINFPSGTITPQDGVFVLEYQVSETNPGNVSLYINNLVNRSSISSTTSGNFSGKNATNRFTLPFPNGGGLTTFVVEVVDLAGNRANSSSKSITFLSASSSGYSPGAAGGSSGTGQYYQDVQQVGSQNIKTFWNNYGGIVIIAGIIGFIWWRKKRK